MNVSNLVCGVSSECSSPAVIACNCGITIVFLCEGCLCSHVLKPGNHMLLNLNQAKQLLSSSISQGHIEESYIKYLKIKSDILAYVQNLKDFKNKITTFKLEIVNHIEKTFDTKLEEIDLILDRTYIYLHDFNQESDNQTFKKFEEYGIGGVLHSYIYNIYINTEDIKQALNDMIVLETKDSSQIETQSHSLKSADLNIQIQELQELIQAQTRRSDELENRINHLDPNTINKETNRTRVKQIRDLYELRLSQSLRIKEDHENVSARRSIERYKHELVNLPIYLMTYAGKEDLAKWVILNQCVREVDHLHRDLKILCADEHDPLHIRLKYQFMKVCKEAPNSLVLNNADASKLEYETIEFESKYQDAYVTTYILKNINQEHFLESFYGISYMLNQPRPEITLYQKIPRDLNKLLALRICSKINECLYKYDLETALQEARLLSMLSVLYIENSDIHFKQIIANLNYSINWAVSKGVGTPEFKQEMRNLIQAINIGDLIPVIDIEALPGELKAIIHRLDNLDYTIWSEGWIDGELAKEFMNEYAKLKNGPVTPWLNMHTKLTNSRMMIQEAERLSYERQANIIPPS